MKVWIVGQYRSGEALNIVWDFQGIFSSEELARKACKTDVYCYFPATIDEELPEESYEIPEVKYPLRGE
jgi:hypothetical protein